MKSGDDSIVIRPRRLGWHTSETYITTGAVVMPTPRPIMARAIISCVKCHSELDGLENPIISHDKAESALMRSMVGRLPNLSQQNPERGPPMGQVMAVTEANHETWLMVSGKSSLSRAWLVIAGYPRPIPDDNTERLVSSEVTI